MRRMFFIFLASMAFSVFADAQIEIKSVEAHQQYPWNGFVDIVVKIQGEAESITQIECSFVATNNETKVAIPVEHITQKGDDSVSDGVWTRQFSWHAAADMSVEGIADIALTVCAELPLTGVQLWEGGPCWAECNIGASKPEEYGYYFWWGDIVGYKRVGDIWEAVDGSQNNFSFSGENCSTYKKSISQLQEDGYVDASGNLVSAHDAATAHLGAPWRMPTESEYASLLSNCTTTWTTRNGVYGRLMTGKGTFGTRSVFFPAAGTGYEKRLHTYGGYYWSATPDSYSLYYASDLYLYLVDYLKQEHTLRYYGYSVRPIRAFSDATVSVSTGVTTHFTLFPLAIKSVEAHQHYPIDGLVDIEVTIQGTTGDVERAECVFVGTNCLTQAAISVDHIVQNGEDTCSGFVWTRRFIWDARSDVGDVKISDVELTVAAEISALPGVRLWKDGPYWAECNLGALQSEDPGHYFWWGDTVGYKYVGNGWVASNESESSFLFNDANCPTYGQNNTQLQSAGYIDASGTLVAAHDAATVRLGTPWRMPTDSEFSSLISNCTTTWTTRNGVSGRLVTGKGLYAFKSVFFPSAGYGKDSILDLLGSSGYCWSSTPSPSLSDSAWNLGFNSSRFFRFNSGRYLGRSIRPIRSAVNDSTSAGSITTRFQLDFRKINQQVNSIKVDSVVAQQRSPWNGLVDIAVVIQNVGDDVSKVECLFVASNIATQTAIPVQNLTHVCDSIDSDNVLTRRYVWNAGEDVESLSIVDVALTVAAHISLDGVQLWENGPYWSECNVGSSEPENCGYYFWWGDTVGYVYLDNGVGWYAVDGSQGSFTFSNENCPIAYKNNSQLLSMGYIDESGILQATHDAATAYFGKPWRMPTDAEISALVDNCTAQWTTRNGVQGQLITGTGTYSSKSIFIPAVGYGTEGVIRNLVSIGNGIWSSTGSRQNNSYGAWSLSFGSAGIEQSSESRCFGMQVRPVRGFNDYIESSMTTEVFLDCREGLRMIYDEDVVLRYDASWYENATLVRITDNGTVIETGYAGSYNWRLNSDDQTRHVFKLEAFNDDELVATESVEFEVQRIRVKSMEAHQRYPWDGSVDIVVLVQCNTNVLSEVECSFLATNNASNVVIPIQHLTHIDGDTIVDDIKTCRFVWNVAADIAEVNPVAIQLTVCVQIPGVQLWENGPYWAESNVGAKQSEEYGYYFGWGNTVGCLWNGSKWSTVSDAKKEFTFSAENSQTYGKSISSLQATGVIGESGDLEPEYDAAAVLGGLWRMPTRTEFLDLTKNCTTTWETRNGVCGRLVTGKGSYSARSIFLPAGGNGYDSNFFRPGQNGYYWSSTPATGQSNWNAGGLYFNSSSFSVQGNNRKYGLSIRPVRDFVDVFASATMNMKIDALEIPDLGANPTIEEITNVFNEANAEDPTLAHRITNETEYVAFREWSAKVKSHNGDEPIGSVGVLAAPNAWLSYALGSDSLIDAVPTNGQMRVEKFEPTSTAGSFDFTIAIDDIAVGSEATKENLKKVFGLEGGATLDALSSTNVDISFGTPENGKVKFTAGPNDKNADAKTFFMKVKMTP